MIKNIKYFVMFPIRLNYWFCYQSYSLIEKLPFYICGNIKKYFFGLLILSKLVFKHNLFFRKIKKNIDYREIDFIALNYLRDFDLYLRPSYCYYPMAAKIMITKKCNFNCKYCYQKNKKIEEVSIKKLKKILIHLKKLRINNVGFVGGEIFLDFNKLLDCIKISKNFRFKINVLTTNGFWCVNEKIVISYLKALKKVCFNGIISISIGREHQRQIHLSNFVDLNKISRKIFGKNIFLLLIESNTYEEYKSIKKEAENIFRGHYNFRFVALVDKQETKHRNTNKNLYWDYCKANNFLINNNYSFCMGVCSLNKGYVLNLKKNFELRDYLKIENKLLDIINQLPFEKIRDYIKNKNLCREVDNFYVPCELCILLSKNHKLLEKVHNHFIN